MPRKIREASQPTKQLSTLGVMDLEQEGRRMTRKKSYLIIYALVATE